MGALALLRCCLHIECELNDVRRISGIVGFDGNRLNTLAGTFTGFYFYFDRAGLTRPEDFREVHGGASSAWRDGFNVEIGFTAVLDGYGANQRFVLSLFAKLEPFRRGD